MHSTLLQKYELESIRKNLDKRIQLNILLKREEEIEEATNPLTKVILQLHGMPHQTVYHKAKDG